MADNREIVLIGDVHGCITELEELLHDIDFSPFKHRLVFVGDIVDRGPNSVECLTLVRSLCEKGEAECLMGNHENKHVRYYGHEVKQTLTGKKNPMRRMSQNDSEAHKRLTEDDIKWMRRLPLKILLKNNNIHMHPDNKWFAIHGGLEPAYDFKNQSPNQIIRCRYVDKNGRAVSLNPDKTKPAGTVYWTDMWNGHESIVYGHCVHSLKKPLDEHRYGFIHPVRMVGIDTGCVFGGCLTAFFLNEDRFVQVKAKREYYHINAQFTDE